MQIYLAVTPAEAQEASRFRCSLAHVAYCIGPDSTLLRQNLLLQTRGGLLSVTDRGAPFIASPERLSAAALRECGRRSYGGVLLDFEQPPAPDRLAFAETLARRLSPRPVYVPESYAAASGAIPLICTAISGGNFVQRLQEAALSAAGNSRTCWTGSPPPFSSPRTCAPGISPMPGTARRISSSSTTRTPFPRSCGPAGPWASPPPS